MYIAFERKYWGRLRFTLAPAKYEDATKGQEGERYIERPHFGKASTASERKHTFKAFRHSRPQLGLSL